MPDKMEREPVKIAEDELKVEEDLKVKEDLTYDEEEFLSAEEELKVEVSYKGETEIELQVYDDSYPTPEKVKNSNPSQEQDVQQKTGQNVEQDVREPVMNPKVKTSKETGSKALGMKEIGTTTAPKPVKIEQANIEETGSKALEIKDMWDAAKDAFIVLITPEKVKNSNPSQEIGTTRTAPKPVKIEQANIDDTGSKALGIKDLWDAAKDVYAVLAPDANRSQANGTKAGEPGKRTNKTRSKALERKDWWRWCCCCCCWPKKVKNSKPSQENGTTTAGPNLVKREQVTNINETGSWEMEDLWGAAKHALTNIVLTPESEERYKNRV